MVARNPKIEEIFELPVLGNLARREMAMIIEDRLGFGVPTVKLTRGPRSQ
jgi:hypothetical protein